MPIKQYKFYLCLNLGLSCFIFFVLWKKDIITGPTRKEKKTDFIKSIYKSGIIAIDEENRDEFTLNTGNFVKFKVVKGIEKLNDGKHSKITFLSNNSFSNDENYILDNCIIDGTIEEVVFLDEKNYFKFWVDFIFLVWKKILLM